MSKTEIELLSDQIEKTQRTLEKAAEKSEMTLMAFAKTEIELKSINKKVDKMAKIVSEGNGNSLITRMSLSENEMCEVKNKVANLEKEQKRGLISDASTDVKVKILWGSIGTLGAGLAAALIKMFFVN